MLPRCSASMRTVSGSWLAETMMASPPRRGGFWGGDIRGVLGVFFFRGGGGRVRPPRLRSRLDHGGPGVDRNARGKGSDAEGRDVGIRSLDGDMRWRDAQFLCADLGQHGEGTLPHVGFAGQDHGAAILVDFQKDGGPVPVADGTVAADMHCRRHAKAAPQHTRTLWACALRVPVDGLADMRQAGFQRATADLPAMDG